MKTKNKTCWRNVQEWWSEGESNPIDKLTNLPSRTTRSRPASTEKILHQKTTLASGFDGAWLSLRSSAERQQIRQFAPQFIETVFFCQIKIGNEGRRRNSSFCKEIKFEKIHIYRDGRITKQIDELKEVNNTIEVKNIEAQEKTRHSPWKEIPLD